jgi:hypothetical protein
MVTKNINAEKIQGNLDITSVSATTISATTYYNLPSSTFTGGTVSGATNFTNGLTANTISANTINVNNYIDFATGSTNPVHVGGRVFYDNTEHSLAYIPNINSNVIVKMGQQLYTRVQNASGTLIPKGSVLQIQTASSGMPNVTLAISVKTLSKQVIGLAADDIQIGGEGLVLNNGLLSGITINTFNIGDILYVSDTVPGGYVNSTTSLQYSSRSNQIGYVIATGTTLGQIYVNINNEDTNLSLSDTERNILEGNVISTGIYEFTGMTTASTTTINIAPAKGWVVYNTYQYATNPYVTNIIYTGQTGYSITNIATQDSTYIVLTSGGTINQFSSQLTPQQRRENLLLGKVVHPNRSTIQTINNIVDYDVSPMSALRDMFMSIKLINDGITVFPNGGNLNIDTTYGNLYGMGVNWVNNQLNPNQVTIFAKTAASFFYKTQTGGTTPSVITIDPTKYDLNGVITSVGVAGVNDATNQRIYMYSTGTINIQYGQKKYGTLALALASQQTETFIRTPQIAADAILIGLLAVRNDIIADGQGLNNTDYAIFTPASIFGESVGGVNGISTTTLQQAYNNSTTPEITINSTLDGLSIKNGTGNADNVTNLLEGVDSGGTTTSLIRADGSASFLNLTAGTAFFGSGANGTQFEADGTMKCIGSATTWEDIIISASNLRGGGTPPAFVAMINGIYAYSFVNGVTDILYGSFELPHSYKEGSDIELHVHWAPASTNVGNVIFNCEYTVCDRHGGVMSASTIASSTGTTVGVINKCNYTTLVTITGSTAGGMKIGEIIPFALSRLGGATGDTFSGDVFILSIGAHYEQDTLGSRQQISK